MRHSYGLNCVPPEKDDIEILTPSTSECNLTWKVVFLEVIKLKRGLECGPIIQNIRHRQELGERHGTASERINPDDTLILDFWPPGLYIFIV